METERLTVTVIGLEVSLHSGLAFLHVEGRRTPIPVEAGFGMRQMVGVLGPPFAWRGLRLTVDLDDVGVLRSFAPVEEEA